MLAQRIATAAVAIPLLVVVLALGRWWLAGLVLLIAVLAAGEVFRLLRHAGYPAVAWVGVPLATLLVADGALSSEPGAMGVAVVTLGLMAAAGASFLQRDPRAGLGSLVATVTGGLYVGLLGFLLRIVATDVPLPAGAPLGHLLDGGRWWLVVTVLGVWAYDTGAYLVGRTVGGPRFFGHLSPAKTWAGTLGGFVAVTAVVALLSAGLGRDAEGALVLGPLIGLAAQAGDLTESMLKRAAGAKDSGRLFPGHGGALDRIDSLLFAGAAVYLYVLLVVR